MKIAICDDEQVIREEINAMLDEYFRSNNMTCIVDQFATGESFVKTASASTARKMTSVSASTTAFFHSLITALRKSRSFWSSISVS